VTSTTVENPRTTVDDAGAGDARRTHRAAGRYGIDAARTRVEVGVRVAGLRLWGVFDAVDGELEVPGDLRAARASVTVDAARLSWGGRGRDRVAGRVLDSAAHPLIRFDADHMEPILESFVTHDGDRPLWALVGTLTLCGVTRPVRVAVDVVRPTDNGAAVQFGATTVVRRADFGMRRRGLIGDTVRVRIKGVAAGDDG
jgi:polyisoprenoid-binding protein YceI